MNNYVLDLQRRLGFTGDDLDGGYGKLTHAAVLARLTPSPVIEPVTVDPMKWAASQPSLKGVHPRLLAVLDRLKASGTPFAVIEGVRNSVRQAELVAAGKSRRLDSRHLTGHAVDIAPLVNGKISWNWPDYYPLAQAMRLAVIAEGCTVIWGGVWDRGVHELTDMKADVAAYIKRYKAAHPPYMVKGELHVPAPLIDGPHWELSAKEFPA